MNMIIRQIPKTISVRRYAVPKYFWLGVEPPCYHNDMVGKYERKNNDSKWTQYDATQHKYDAEMNALTTELRVAKRNLQAIKDGATVNGVAPTTEQFADSGGARSRKGKRNTT